MSQGSVKFDLDTQQLVCLGDWNLATLPSLKDQLASLRLPTTGELTVNGNDISAMDTAGAWLLTTASHGKHFEHFSDQHQKLLSLVKNKVALTTEFQSPQPIAWITRLGMQTCQQVLGLLDYLNFTGRLYFQGLRIAKSPRLIRWKSIVGTIDTTGLQALAIIGLLSFLIGVVIAYQMGFQLRNYGANVFIVNLLGLSILREFGPLLCAIMVAGRTGSSFTAQLGIMKINQEIDALDTMGVTPSELLILPRIIALFIALPLLTIWSDMFGIFGGMIMANNMLGVTWYDFLERFQREIPLRALILGLGKAPVFALIIASVGCFQGFKVSGSAESVGAKTTRSVVLAIFFIILADAAFSIIFSKLRL